MAAHTRKDLTVSEQVATATGEDKESLEKSLFSARSQIAFYASTPTYKPVMEVHGWDKLQPRLLSISREGKWLEMATLIDDEMLNTFAVTGTVDEVSQQLVKRCGGGDGSDQSGRLSARYRVTGYSHRGNQKGALVVATLEDITL